MYPHYHFFPNSLSSVEGAPTDHFPSEGSTILWTTLKPMMKMVVVVAAVVVVVVVVVETTMKWNSY